MYVRQVMTCGKATRLDNSIQRINKKTNMAKFYSGTKNYFNNAFVNGQS